MQLEDCISQHTDALFSHGICKGSAVKLYAGYLKDQGHKTGG